MKLLDGERLFDNQDLCLLLQVSKRSLQRYRSNGVLAYHLLWHKTYYKESDVLEFISRNMEEVVLGGEKVLKIKEGTGKKSPGKTKEKKEGRRTASHR